MISMHGNDCLKSCTVSTSLHLHQPLNILQQGYLYSRDLKWNT